MWPCWVYSLSEYVYTPQNYNLETSRINLDHFYLSMHKDVYLTLGHRIEVYDDQSTLCIGALDLDATCVSLFFPRRPALTLFIFWPPIYSVLSLPSLPWSVTGIPVPLLPVSLQWLKQFLEIEQEPSVVDKKIDGIPWPTHSLCSSQTKKNKLKTRKTLDTGTKGNFPGW